MNDWSQHRNVIQCLAVAMHGMSVLEGLWGKNTDKEGMMREGRQRSGVFIYSVA